MATETIVSGDAATVSVESRFAWGPVFAGALVAIAVSFFLIILGAGVGLAIGGQRIGATTFFTLGAIYFFAAQAFGMAAGGHLVGRLIGPMAENSRQEEFRAGAHGLVMWGLAVVASLAIVGLSSAVAGGTLSAGLIAARSGPETPVAGYWLDRLFVPATNSAQVTADKAEAGRILAHELAEGDNAPDGERLARLVAADTGVSQQEAANRVAETEASMHDAAATARKSAMGLSLWTAFALLFGAVVAVAAAISARWEDDKISFGFERRTV